MCQMREWNLTITKELTSWGLLPPPLNGHATMLIAVFCQKQQDRSRAGGYHVILSHFLS